MKNKEKWNVTFWKIYSGQAVSIITSSIVQFAIIWYITYKTGSAFWLSMASLCGFLPQGILGLFIGSYIDKRNRKKIMIISDGLIAAVSLIMCIISFITNLPIWVILICLALRSIGSAFHNPSLQASIPLIVPQEKLLKYSGYSQAIQSISLILSPAIAALLYDKFSLGSIILLDVIGAVFAIFTLAISVIPKQKTETTEKVDFIKDSKLGFKAIINNKLVSFIFLISAIFMLLYMPINALFPLMTTSHFNGSTMDVGIVEILFAIGMLVGSLLLSSSKMFQNKKTNIFISLFLMGLAITISGLLPNNMFYIFAILCAVIGFTGPIINGTVSTIFSEQIDPEILGRVFSNYLSLSVIVMPIGLFLSGIFADVIGINIWFLITGLLLMLLAFFHISKKLKYNLSKKSN